ncbi:DNA mismatch repair endonuclease MutL [Bacillus sp. FJAT-42376]|uniref:DNA mismatch repair endonuclease MutL n=1 Tax=Bacillus sp. FJAT-42376 TaxID=2014076 RepID=UPI000F4D7862|nr:DNA mismatch repair endonuclease MutL [Bacillus sp. FJAT-42376]AZB43025.1 DNA mismatch repair endonuclease MutL [Bacillus sp. FJAT-42376]
MGKIVLLDDQLSNKIAAGEVVERPASVVKELVENAIDANSSVIEIELEEAGLGLIRIIDNGDGMEPEDGLNAFQRHATSKIKDENDLFRIRTLGFRGEALPSIASVSHIEMKTSNGADEGTHLKLVGGKVEEHKASSSRKGTDITVSQLFFNTPARLKYMKTVHTELGNITDAVNRLAMANASISFRLTHNGKTILHTNGNGDVRQVIASIYGLSIAKKMVPVSLQSLDFQVNGYIALPEITRASRNYISTIINGRFIKNYTLAKAILEGYHTLLPIGRYPIAFLNIEMDPLLVDVNVHPSKMEVRLSKEAELYELVSDGVKQAFRKKTLIPESGVQKAKPAPPKDEQQALTFNEKYRAAETKINSGPLNQEKELQAREEEPSPLLDKMIKESHPAMLSFESEEPQISSSAFEERYPSEQNEQIDERAESEPRVPAMYPIGQMHGTYILAQNESGLYMIDQHAAQERIKYEFFREKVGSMEKEVQEMLVPITLHYSHDESLKISEHQESLAEVGVFLEPFGGSSFIVRSHPQWFPSGKEQFIIEEMIQQVLELKKPDVKKLREEAAILMSCKASIKANRYLRLDEMTALLEELRRAEDPFTCPHGRPVIVHFTTYEMEKMFKRIM